MGPLLGGLVLAALFLVELLAVAAAFVWGRWAAGLWLGLLAAAAVVVVWGLFASPKARYGRGAVRPVTKVLVFGLTAAGLAVSGHAVLAAWFVGVVVVVHVLAALPSVRALSPTTDT